jgi:beta-phosphoglucomutase-like phosphatase (HAD superfamily)
VGVSGVLLSFAFAFASAWRRIVKAAGRVLKPQCSAEIGDMRHRGLEQH